MQPMSNMASNPAQNLSNSKSTIQKTMAMNKIMRKRILEAP